MRHGLIDRFNFKSLSFVRVIPLLVLVRFLFL